MIDQGSIFLYLIPLSYCSHSVNKPCYTFSRKLFFQDLAIPCLSSLDVSLALM